MQVTTQVQLNADEVLDALGRGLTLVETHPFATLAVLVLAWLLVKALLALAQVYRAKNTTNVTANEMQMKPSVTQRSGRSRTSRLNQRPRRS